MKRPLLESEKNFIKCAILMVIVGICLMAMGKTTLGIGCIGTGIIFAVIAVMMITKGEGPKTMPSKSSAQSQPKKQETKNKDTK